MYKIVFFVPEANKEDVKNAMFTAGGGKLGDYEQCSWEALGQGQFKPLTGSNPHIGSLNRLEIVAEYRVEMACDKPYINAVVQALRLAHPYEEPAFDVWATESF